MKILIVSSESKLFTTWKKNSPLEITICTDLKKIPMGNWDIAYLDQDVKDCRKSCREVLEELQNIKSLPWGILDFHRKFKDPMTLIYHGWADYLCGKDLLKGLTPQRISQALFFFRNKRAIPHLRENQLEGIPSGKDWTKVEEGKEYLFGMLYAEMIPHEDLDCSFSETEIQRLQKEWQNLLSQFFDPWYGYLWINNGWSSVILFPYDGKELHAMEGAIEFLLNAPTFHFPQYPRALRIKLVGHLASTLFKKRENTAHIISESLNDLFHMGLYHAKEDRLYFTENLKKLLPHSLDSYLEEPSEFEGHNLFPLRMRIPTT